MGKTIGLIMALQDKCSPNIKKVADKIGITEKEAKKLNNEINKLSKDLGGKLKGACTAVSAGIGAVVATAGVLVNKSMEAGDRVDKMSQKIGMSRKSFQEWDYIMSQNGGNVESLQMGYKTLANQMDNVRKGSKDSIGYFKKLGVAVKDGNGQFRNQEDVFNNTVRALQRMKNPTEKAVIANKLFGKSALEMKPLLNQSAESVDGLRQKANELGMVMSDDAIDAGVKLKDTIDTIQRTFSAFGNQIGADIMPAIQSLADELVNHLPEIKSSLTPVFQGLSNTVKFLIEHFEGLKTIAVVCLSTFVAYKAINGVISTIKTLQSVIKAVSLAQGVWNALMIANPIGLIAVGVGLLVGGIYLLVKNWDAVKNAFVSFYEKIKPALTTIGAFIKKAFNMTPLGMFINGIKTLVQNWDKVTEAVGKAIRAIKIFFGGKGTVEVEKTDKETPKKNAVGTSFYSGGATRINEFGGEIVDLPRGSRIIPHDISSKMAKNSGGNITIPVTIMGNVIGNQEFINQLAEAFARKLQVAMAVR
jgi:hypothetical protein